MFAPFIIVAAALCIVAVFLLSFFALWARRRKARASACALYLLRRVGSVTEPLTPEGAVLVGGELWRARARTGERVGRGEANVRVVGARGHLLEVESVG